MSEDYPYLGTGWGFPPTFNKSSRSVQMISDEEDIRSSLEILLCTSIGERIMQPTYGCDLRKMLFEPLDTSLKAYIKNLIESAILYFEPRIRLIDVTLTDKPYEGLLEVDLDYIIRATNSRYNFVYPFYKDEGVDIHP